MERIEKIQKVLLPWNEICFQTRRIGTGLAWAAFGLGGLTLSVTWFPFLNFFVSDREKRIRLARSTISSSFRLFLNVVTTLRLMSIEERGFEKIDGLKGTLIVANHPTILDYVLIAAQLPNLDCVVKACLKNNFFLHGVVEAAGYLLNDESERLLEECGKRLVRGENILIFPEGTRSIPGKPLKFHRGVAHIALRYRCPIRTIRISCSDKWLDKNSKWYQIPRKKPSISLEVREQVDSGAFLEFAENSYSLSARRLTNYLTRILERPIV